MEKEKLAIIKGVLGSYYFSGGEHLFFCPYCNHHKRKLSINLDINAYKCWVCDSHGNVRKIVNRYGTYSQKAEWRKLSNTVDISEFDNIFSSQKETEQPQWLELPEGFIFLGNKKLPPSANTALSYLKERNIFKEDILKWKIGYCHEGEYKNRIIFPSFNIDGRCNYYIARNYANEWPKYKNPPASKDIVFNELYIDWKQDIIIVEGIFDAVVAGNALPLLGSTIRDNSNLFSKIINNCSKIYIALDEDAEKKALRIIKTMLQYGIEIYKIDTSGQEDVGSMARGEFERRKQEAVLFNAGSLMMHEIMQI